METIVQKIANQLGMPVDQAGQFLAEQLPNYASMRMMQISACLIIVAAIAVICLVGLIISLAVAKDSESTCATAFLCCFISVTVFLVLMSFFLLPDLIGWMNNPEAMLIYKALQAG